MEEKKGCLKCGAEIKNTPGRRPKKYCSDNCRQKHWQAKNKSNLPIKNKKPATPQKKVIAPAKESEKEAPASTPNNTIQPTFANDIEKMIWEDEQEQIKKRNLKLK